MKLRKSSVIQREGWEMHNLRELIASSDWQASGGTWDYTWQKLFSGVCALFFGRSYICLFFSLGLSQPCVEGRVVEANTSVLGPFANIYFALCQLACVMAARVRPVPWVPCYYFAPLEIRQKDITLNTQNQKLTVLLGTPKRKQHICYIHNRAETENQNLCLSKRPGLS